MKRIRGLLTAAVVTAVFQGVAPAVDDNVDATSSAGVQATAAEPAIVTSGDPASDEVREVKSTSGKIAEYWFVTSEDGEQPQEYSIRVDSTVERSGSGTDDSKPVKAKARVVVIGPDGKEKSFEVDGNRAALFRLELRDAESPKSVVRNLDSILLLKDRLAAETGEKDESGEHEIGIVPEPGEERYVIGVRCDPVSDALRSHLHLGDHGLLVVDVLAESAAAEAGLQINDIIVAVADEEIGSSEDLVKSITASEGKPLSVQILRAGEKQVVTVTPRKMKVPVVVAPATENLERTIGFLKDHMKINAKEQKQFLLPENIEDELLRAYGRFRLRQVHPGVVVEGRELGDGDWKERVERLKALAKEVDTLAQEVMTKEPKEPSEQNSTTEAQMLHRQMLDQMLDMQEQMKVMRKQMEALEAQLQKQTSGDKSE